MIPDSPAPLVGALPDRIKEVVGCAEIETAARILGGSPGFPRGRGNPYCRFVESFISVVTRLHTIESPWYRTFDAATHRILLVIWQV